MPFTPDLLLMPRREGGWQVQTLYQTCLHVCMHWDAWKGPANGLRSRHFQATMVHPPEACNLAHLLRAYVPQHTCW